MNIISLNDTLIKADEARLSIDERGFRFGDGVFETIPVYAGIPYLLEYHLERLETGLSSLKIRYDTSSLAASVQSVLAANRAQNCVVRLYVSRGSGSQGYLPVAPTPTTLIQLLPMPEAPKEPVTLWLSTWEKISPRALPVNSKLAQGINATLARMEAQENGCYEALQLNAEGYISEASSANIFWLSNGALFTPALSTGALAGVTRRRLIEIASTTVIEGEFTLEHLHDADAVFLTNSVYGIMPVHSLLPTGIAWKNHSSTMAFQKYYTLDIENYSAQVR